MRRRRLDPDERGVRGSGLGDREPLGLARRSIPRHASPQPRVPNPVSPRSFMSDDTISRREFVGATTTAALAFTIVPRHVLGGRGYVAPSDRLNVACVGVGGMGMSNMTTLVTGGENVVAVCDVDYAYVERSLAGRTRAPTPRPGMRPEEIASQRKEYGEAVAMQAAYAKAKKYDDFREMLRRE